MSYKSKEVREARAAVANEMATLIGSAKKENRVLTAEEREKFDKFDTEQLRLQGEAESLERMERFDAINTRSEEKSRPTLSLTKPSLSDSEKFGFWLKAKAGCLSYDQERQADGIDLRSDRFSFNFNPSKKTGLQNRSSVAQDGSGFGSELIPTGIPADISTYLTATTPIRAIARNWTTPSGNPMNYPKSDDTANAAVIIAESTQDSVLSVPFSNVSSVVYTYSSGVVLIPYEWLQDSVVDVQEYITEEMQRRFLRGTSAHLVTGSGSSQPTGYSHAAGTGVTMASKNAPTYAELLSWYHSVPLFYRSSPSFAFMVSDSMAQAIRGLTDSQGQPLWSPGYVAGQGLQGAQPDRLFGKPLFVDASLQPTGTINNVVGTAGDFSQFVVRNVENENLSMVVLKERYADYRQIGIFGYHRLGSFALQSSALKNIICPAS